MSRFLIAGGLIVVGAIGVLNIGSRSLTSNELTVRVTGAEERCSRTGEDCKYLVYTDQGTFENTDDMIAGKFRSSDFHARFIDEDYEGCYRLKTVGIRFGPTSSYPNVVREERVPCPGTEAAAMPVTQ